MRIRRQHAMDGLSKPGLVAGEIECGQPEAQESVLQRRLVAMCQDHSDELFVRHGAITGRAVRPHAPEAQRAVRPGTGEVEGGTTSPIRTAAIACILRSGVRSRASRSCADS
jgi:hypothetical protein